MGSRPLPRIIVKERLLVVAIVFFIVWCMYTYMNFCFEESVFLEWKERGVGSVDTLQLAWFFLTAFLFKMMMWSYVMCLITPAGEVPVMYSFAHVIEQTKPMVPGVSQKEACDTCKTFKPTRSHHCSRCQRCMLKYDHHCPWIARCVGFYNYKLFLLFIWYTFWLSFLVNVTLSRAMYLEILARLHQGSSPGTFTHQWSHDTHKLIKRGMPVNPLHNEKTVNAKYFPPSLYFVFFVSAVVQSFTFSLLWRHWRLLDKNSTTVEEVMYGPDFNSEFDLGVTENWMQVFGGGSVPTTLTVKHTLSAVASYGTMPEEEEEESVQEVKPRRTFGWWLKALIPVRAYPLVTREMSSSRQHGCTFQRVRLGRSTSVVIDTSDDEDLKMAAKESFGYDPFAGSPPELRAHHMLTRM